MIIKNVNETDGVFKNEQKLKIKEYIKLCRYDVVPSIIFGSALAGGYIPSYTTIGAVDVFLFGGISGAALALAINAAITGIKVNKNTKDKIRENLKINEENNKGKKL